MSRFRRGGWLLALVVAGSLGLVACGGGSDKISAADDTTSTTTSSAGSTSSGSVANAASCQAATTAMAKVTAGSFTGTDVEAQIKQLDAVVAAAPSDIKPDLAIILGVYNDMAKALKDAGYDPTKTPTAADSAKFAVVFQTIGPKLADPKYTAAATHVANWFQSGCK